jgi:hypothetical protein
MAVDKNGDLYVFELKAWESDAANLLQVLRYGQIYGAAKYEELDAWYRKSPGHNQSLKAARDAKFGGDLKEDNFNQKQVFVVMTNGLDYRTREAIRYWRSCRLDVRPWVYRVYAGLQDNMLLEMSAFRVSDNPYEDLAEGYYILNTNIKNNQLSHQDMLANAKAAAYYDPWKFKIERLNKGDTVFLYQSGIGIVALGETDGKVRKGVWEGTPDEEYSTKLNKFQILSRPLTASEIKSITGIDYVFMSVMFGLDADSGKKIKKFLHQNGIV